jgi:hypothetical protein
MVSAHWWKRLMLAYKDTRDGEKTNFTLKLSNVDLYTKSGRIRSGLELHRHYEAVTEVVWNFLYSKYGADTLTALQRAVI